MKVLGHLVKTLFHAFFRILFTALLSAALAVACGLLVAYEGTRQWPPHQLTVIVIAIVAVLAAYAGGMTVLMSEAIKALVYTVKEAEKETYTVGNIVERGVKAVEHAKAE